ncbi:hypothetical protein PIB30_084263, partial [Stylosanthes scabra]|nr:hypothetical protein [Stylosanthes scabra]
RDAHEMVKIAVERGHVELFVVYDDVRQEGFPEIGYVDVGVEPHVENANEEAGGEEAPVNGQNEVAGFEEAVLNGGVAEDGAEKVAQNRENELAGAEEVDQGAAYEDKTVADDYSGNLEGLVTSETSEGGVGE